MIGDDQGLAFELAWDDLTEDLSAAGRSWGSMTASVRGERVWGRNDSVRWTWSELLAHLAWNWPWLTLEEGLPHGATATLDAVVRNEIHAPEDLNEEQLDRWEDSWWSFTQAHDLASAMPGIALRQFWLLRRGLEFEVATPRTYVRLPAQQVIDTLEALGTAIADRIAPANDEVSRHLLAKWRDRKLILPEVQERLLTGLSDRYLQELEPDAGVRRAWFGVGTEGKPTVLSAVARMAGPVAVPEVLKKLIELVIPMPASDTTRIDALAAVVADSVEPEAPAHSQGHALALRLRSHLGCGLDPAPRLRQLLQQLGVTILETRLGTPEIDATALWSDDHGPAIVLNKDGRRNQGGVHAKEATLAHELCHMLVDRRGALPLAEVLGGSVRRDAEQRANAFAAEFLLPRQAAAEEVARAPSLLDAIKRLIERYSVGSELTAWQIYRSPVASQLTYREQAELKNQLRDPQARARMWFS